MRIIWNRYLVGAFLLAFMSLLCAGCGDYSKKTSAAPQAAPATKRIAGVVSYLDTGLPLPGATVTAYAIDANGAQSATPLGGTSGITISDVDGSYALQIPADYTGSLMILATASSATSPAKTVKKTAYLPSSGQTIRSLVPAAVLSQTVIPPVMVSFATNAVVTFLEQNVTSGSTAAGFTPTGFSSDNILKANVVMETFFGPNFSQVPPPQSELDLLHASLDQQNLLVSIRALFTVSTTTPMTQIVVSLASTGLGSTLSSAITDQINLIVSVTLDGVLPPAYQPSTAIEAAISSAAGAPVVAPDLTDLTPPSAPANLVASAAGTNSVNLTWSAATDTGTGVAGYSLYRATGTGAFQLLETLGKTATSYQDASVVPAVAYRYQVAAFDVGRNISDFSNIASVTTPDAGSTPPASSGFAVTGKVATASDAGLPGVLLVVTNAGTGSAVSAANGSYSFDLLNGNYLITPVLAGYQFSPASRSVTVSGAAVSGLDFVATLDGTAVGTVTYPTGGAGGTVTYPNGSTTTVVTYPNGTVIGGVSYPAGTVITTVTYPNGAVIGGVSYPAGTVFTTVAFTSGTVVLGGVSYPAGAVLSTVAYPNGTLTVSASYPGGAVIGGVSYPAGSVVTTTSYPNGSLTVSVSYPGGAVVGGVSYPAGTVVTTTSFPGGTVSVTVHYPNGTLSVSVTYPSGVVIGGVSYPAGTVITNVSYPTGTVLAGVSYPAGSVVSSVSFPDGSISTSVTVPGSATISVDLSFPGP
jgi:antitoxin component YwqK of YwqJK toxin-antitoxin module